MSSTESMVDRKWRWILGGVVFLISFLTYLRSVAPTTSFWDCGEFIACSFNLGVMHPPGSPLYLLIGRILTLLPLAKDIGLRINLFSVFVSGLTILLTFLIIEQLIRRWRGAAASLEDRLIIYLSSAFGALAFAFTDSFWFNAVEAEVYAFSMFFTALVVWLALYWGEHSRREGSMLLLFFIFYLFGLAAGVHLLNILAFPVVLLITYFHDNLQARRLMLLIFLQIVVPMTLYAVFFQYDPSHVGYQELLTHQAKAQTFLKWFGFFWIIGTLGYMYYKDRAVFAAWWIAPLLVILAYSAYYVLYLRAGLSPPINENNPSTWDAMRDYLNRKQYGEEDLFLTFLHRKADFWRYQIHMMYTRYFGWQFIGQGTLLDARDRIIEIISFRGLWGLPFLVGLWGAVHHFYRDWKRAVIVLVLFIVTGYAIIIYLNQPDPQPRERDYSYVGSFFAFALWIGIGMAGILEWLAEAFRNKQAVRRICLTGAVLILMLAVPVNMFAFNFHSHDRSGNYVAYDYSYNTLQSCEPNAIVFTNGDNDTFPLWFLQDVYGIRKDVRVVCLSLLNTPWYIKQLRDQEPKVPINMSDRAIDELDYGLWKAKKVSLRIPKEVQDKELERLRSKYGSSYPVTMQDTLQFTLAPTYPEDNPRILLIKDKMIIRIINDNKWKKPIYFATTVSHGSQLNLQRFFRIDGLAYRLMPYVVDDPEHDVIENNLLNVYHYRNLDNPHVYYNNNTLRLFINFRMAFLELAQSYLKDGKKEDAARILTEMSKRIPEKTIPYDSRVRALIYAKAFQDAGLEPNPRERMKHVVAGHHMSKEEELYIAHFYFTNTFGDWQAAEEIYLDLLRNDPDDRQAAAALVYMYDKSEQYDKGIDFLEGYLMRNPADAYLRSQLEDLKKKAGK